MTDTRIKALEEEIECWRYTNRELEEESETLCKRLDAYQDRIKALEDALREAKGMFDEDSFHECDDPTGCPWASAHRLIAKIKTLLAEEKT